MLKKAINSSFLFLPEKIFIQHKYNIFDNKKQIIISSDNSPDDLKNLEDRLRTRFNWGLKVNIFPPDNELRKKK